MMRALLLTTLTLSVAAHAADGEQLARCASVDDDARRLACYDALAGREARDPETAPEVALPMPTALVPTPAPRPAPAPTPTPAAGADAVAGFGAEQLPRPAEPQKDEPDRIESFLPGRFEGWDSDTRFELENGQVWQCVNCRNVYYVRERPRVVVERSFLGSYWLKVEGLNQQARVRRVK